MQVDFHPAALREVEDAQAWFTIYYREKSGTLNIVAVAHQKRRPGYWSAR